MAVKSLFNNYEKYFIFITILISCLVSYIFNSPIISIITIFICLIEEILSAKKLIWVCFITLISYVFYLIVSFQSSLWGEVMVVLFFYFPMTLIQFIYWKKNSVKGKVKSYSIGLNKTLIIIILCLILSSVYSFLLKYIGDPYPLLDSLSTVFAIVMTFMMVFRQNEFWILWMIAIAVDIALWFLVGDYVISVFFVAILFNCFYGYNYWKKE